MHFGELTAPEQRVLGCLIEKRWTTPDQYPLSLNALRLACNQSTNRDPVTAYDETTVREAAQRLCRYGLARLASGHSSRATKYRHLAEESLGLDREQLAILCVLLLRGSQTPGELKSRSERMAPLRSLDEVERVLGELGERGYARRLHRRPGQKEDRFEQLLGGTQDTAPGTQDTAPGTEAAVPVAPFQEHEPSPFGGTPPIMRDGAQPPVPAVPASAVPGPTVSTPAAPASDAALEARVAALESEVRQLRAALEELRAGVD